MSTILEHIKSHVEEEYRQTIIAETATTAAADCKRCAEALVAGLKEDEKEIHDKWVQAFTKKNAPAS